MFSTVLKYRRPLKVTSPQTIRCKSAVAQRIRVGEEKINELESQISIDFSDYSYDLQAIKSYEERVKLDKSITRVSFLLMSLVAIRLFSFV